MEGIRRAKWPIARFRRVLPDKSVGSERRSHPKVPWEYSPAKIERQFGVAVTSLRQNIDGAALASSNRRERVAEIGARRRLREADGRTDTGAVECNYVWRAASARERRLSHHGKITISTAMTQSEFEIVL